MSSINPASDDILGPKTTHFEFGGPVGALSISVGLPLLIEVLYFSCNSNGCPAGWSNISTTFKTTTLLSKPVLGVYLLWLISLVLLDFIIPGEKVKGTTLRTGGHLMYKFNGTRVVCILAGLLLFRAYATDLQLPELVFVYENFIQLANSSLLVAAVMSTLLYIASFRKNTLLALGGNSGNFVYDWFIGRELNPRIGPLDIKLFLEMRPGLLLWIILDLAMAHHQYLKYGHVTAGMILVCIFQSYYVIEGTFYENGLISMIDTTTDGLGFMLVFGDISLVPFTYCLQARYLADHPVYLPVWGIIGIIAVYIFGLIIFRASNNEKGRFKAGDPRASHLKYLQSASGSKLIVSGWWGLARHINYTGDWVSSWAYCLPCGFGSIIPYYYVAYFASLLIHREQRDDAKCAAKYGPTWDEYKQKVPYRFIPGLI